MSQDEFRKLYEEYYEESSNNKKFKSILPTPESIYLKDFHFLDEPLIKKK